MATDSSLTNLQRELLDLFALELPEAELHEVKHLLARYVAEKHAGDGGSSDTKRKGFSAFNREGVEEHRRVAAERLIENTKRLAERHHLPDDYRFDREEMYAERERRALGRSG